MEKILCWDKKTHQVAFEQKLLEDVEVSHASWARKKTPDCLNRQKNLKSFTDGIQHRCVISIICAYFLEHFSSIFDKRRPDVYFKLSFVILRIVQCYKKGFFEQTEWTE